VFSFVIAGGEPFLFPRLIDLCQEFKDRLFLVLTNGTALTEEHYRQLKKTRNMVVIVSVEGGPDITDARRGRGVFGKALSTIDRLNSIGVLTGISVTITRLNYEYWMEEEHIDSFIAKDVRIASFIEYIPLTPVSGPSSEGTSPFCTSIPESVENTNGWNNGNDLALMLTPEERERFRERVLEFRSRKPIYLIHSPGDEEKFGGCVSAGRGFAHITPGGDLTPCPVSNIATHNLVKASLRDGLASQLFKEICENEHLLETEGMPCALFAHPREVDELARSVGAYRTG
jgi:MoaA/NifB/PqqE/SkfB family radical SAM enzyme